ncbi:mycoredoxin [soil metagenome]
MTPTEPSTDAAITMYWRPGCGFCGALRQQLDSTGLSYDDVNIWEDSGGAAFVRSVNNGNELVPTVQVGDQVLSNPSLAEVLGAVGDQDPDVDLPTGPEPGRLAKGIHKLLGE